MFLSRKYILLISVLIVWLFVLYKTVGFEPFYKKNITMRIFLKDDLDTDNTSEMVEKIFDSTDRGYRHSIKIDVINFFIKEEILQHPHIRSIYKLDLRKEFFADFDIPLTVLKEGFYKISLKTNQTSFLYLDMKESISSKEIKESKEESFTVFLTKGHHGLRLLYYQMPESKGVQLSYSPAGSKKQYLFGQDSAYISF